MNQLEILGHRLQILRKEKSSGKRIWGISST